MREFSDVFDLSQSSATFELSRHVTLIINGDASLTGNVTFLRAIGPIRRNNI